MAHQRQKEFCEDIRRMVPYLFRGVRVLDIGSMDINGNNRYLFEDSEYVGCDLGEGPNVDVVCPAHEFPTEPESFEVVVSTEALEHDRWLDKTLHRAMEFLRPGGLLMLTCATGDREEHGTENADPACSPFTTDYYCNVSEEMITDVLDMGEFVQYEFRKVNGEDLYFFGLKKQGDMPTDINHCDLDRYLRMYPDVAAAYQTPEQVFQHWLKYGIREDRVMFRK